MFDFETISFEFKILEKWTKFGFSVSADKFWPMINKQWRMFSSNGSSFGFGSSAYFFLLAQQYIPEFSDPFSPHTTTWTYKKAFNSARNFDVAVKTWLVALALQGAIQMVSQSNI